MMDSPGPIHIGAPHMNATRRKPFEVSTLDLLKTAAVLMMIADHIGLYLFPDPWLRIVGRGAAIIFGFLIGVSGATRVPPSWIVLGLSLTALNGWLYPHDAESKALDILISLALTRCLVPYFERLHADNPLLLVPVAIGLALVAEPLNAYLEYGPEVTLLAVLGVAIRLNAGQQGSTAARDAIALVAIVGMSIIALRHFHFEGMQVAGCVGVITSTVLALTRYRRKPVVIPGAAAPLIRFIGRNTLWIYAIHLALFMVIGQGDEPEPLEE